MTAVDVEIFGAGILGLATAWSCLRAGASVRVIEMRRIGAGASGGFVGALAPHTPDSWNGKKQFQLASLLMAEDWWGEAAEAGGVDPGYARVGRLQPVPNRPGQKRLAKQRAAAAGKHWNGQAHWSVTPAAGAWRPQSASGLLVHDSLSARINPARALRCLAAAIRSAGGKIFEGEIAGRGRHFQVRATGYEGILQLNREYRQELGCGEKGQALLLRLDAGGQPQIYGDGIHIVPHADGTTAVGSTSEREFGEPDTVDDKLDDLHARAVRLVPEIGDAPVIARWAGVRPRTVARAPLLGRYPGLPNRFIANGGFKIGFGIAPGVGEAMAALILSGKNEIPPEFQLDALIACRPAGGRAA